MMPYIIELFVFANLAFLAVDIYLAHSVNQFAHQGEWIPFWFSIIGTVLLAAHVARGPKCLGSAYGKWIGYLVGWGSIAVGIAGLFFHLGSHFFEEQTIKNLVYTAPFIAPLAYAGIGFLLLMNRMVPPHTLEWSQWVLFLTLGGFVGNFILSVCDHAQNGFFHPEEWIPVIASAFAVSFLAQCILAQVNRRFLGVCYAMLAVQMLVGLLGFLLHVLANLDGYSSNLLNNLIYGAPVFAPLLFSNLALLGFFGLWNYQHKRFAGSTDHLLSQESLSPTHLLEKGSL